MESFEVGDIAALILINPLQKVFPKLVYTLLPTKMSFLVWLVPKLIYRIALKMNELPELLMYHLNSFFSSRKITIVHIFYGLVQQSEYQKHKLSDLFHLSCRTPDSFRS